MLSQLIARQWETKKNMFHDKSMIFHSFQNHKKNLENVESKIKLQVTQINQYPFCWRQKNSYIKRFGFCQLLGLIFHANPNPVESVSHVHSQKSDFGINLFCPCSRVKTKTKHFNNLPNNDCLCVVQSQHPTHPLTIHD
jgi:hypothetical protein